MLFSINNEDLKKLNYILRNGQHKNLILALENSIDINYKLLLLLKKGYTITIDDGKGQVFKVNKLYKKD